MDLKAQKALAQRLLAKVATRGTVVVRNTALNASEPEQRQSILVKLTERKANDSDDAALIDALLGPSSFPLEGGELTVNGAVYDILSVTQSGVGVEHILQRAVLRER